MVKPDTVIIELSNPQLERDTVTAEWDLKELTVNFKADGDELGVTLKRVKQSN